MDFQNLLIDEFFGFGDDIVQDKFQEILKDKYRTVDSLVVASHNQKIIKTVCNRIIKLDQGRIIEDYRI
jgi:ABC-type polysaccharide/polyol phosphate transport system ATPase subunit